MVQTGCICASQLLLLCIHKCLLSLDPQGCVYRHIQIHLYHNIGPARPPHSRKSISTVSSGSLFACAYTCHSRMLCRRQVQDVLLTFSFRCNKVNSAHCRSGASGQTCGTRSGRSALAEWGPIFSCHKSQVSHSRLSGHQRKVYGRTLRAARPRATAA
jgi:hypothetical protein